MGRVTKTALYVGLTLFILNQGTAAFALPILFYLVLPFSRWAARRAVEFHHLTKRFVAHNNDTRRRWA